MHIHSCLSPCADDDNTPANIAGMAAVAGLDVVALTDHNSCANVPAFVKAADSLGLIAIPGMELTTCEEVHVLCYFRSVEDALRFSDHVRDVSPFIANDTRFFGNQLICDEDDNVIGTEERLLHTASNISFDDVYDILKDYGGVMVPAHVNKTSTSVISNLGFFPPYSKFRSAEVKNPDDVDGLRKAHPYLRRCHIISSSDAHYLGDISDPVHFIHVEEKTRDGVLDMLDTYINED